MTTDISVLPITAGLIESFHHALDVVARERRFLTLLEAPPLPDLRAFVLRGIEKADPAFVALTASEVVGWCDVTRHVFPSHAHRGRLGMGLVPAFRHRGIGRRLIAAALDRAWASGFTRVELDVHADNEAAIALYETVGFTREGVLRHASLIDGQYRDAIAMAMIR